MWASHGDFLPKNHSTGNIEKGEEEQLKRQTPSQSGDQGQPQQQ